MKIILTGGGTAGHVEPALAVAKIMKKYDPACDILFIGRTGGKENDVVIRSGISLVTVPVRGMERKFTPKTVGTFFMTLRAIRKSEKIIRDFGADVVFGTGGYVSFPVVFAGIRRKIPTVLHESNATFGLTVRLLAKRVDKVLVNFPVEKSNDIVTVAVGMPVRPEFSAVSRQDARECLHIGDGELLIVSFGGSLGAERMNEVCLSVMKHFSSSMPKIHHIHACGRRYYESIAGEYPSLCRENGRVRVVPYIDNMPVLLSAADMAVCRAGAATIAELAATATPSVLIPSPHVTDDHQTKNAKRAEDTGGCILLSEDTLTEETLTREIKKILGSASLRVHMRAGIHTLYDPKTEEKIANEILGCIRMSKRVSLP